MFIESKALETSKNRRSVHFFSSSANVRSSNSSTRRVITNFWFLNPCWKDTLPLQHKHVINIQLLQIRIKGNPVCLSLGVGGSEPCTTVPHKYRCQQVTSIARPALSPAKSDFNYTSNFRILSNLNSEYVTVFPMILDNFLNKEIWLICRLCGCLTSIRHCKKMYE